MPKGVPKIKKPRIKKVVITPSDEFKVSLTMADKVYTSRNADLTKALRDLKPTEFKTKGKLVVTKGDKTIERLIPIYKIKMLQFKNEIACVILAKNLKLLMGV